ncbi:DNA helicase [Tanacetum coccineum]
MQGLIHVLDEHNGLVRLFRTARDRCIAGEISAFKIRLYNMSGVRGYELLTADLLGGIVFEDGPRSKTYFDVIIEFKGGPPQRINKLHQSYMSLQFPLLFVFGQSGFYPELQLKPRDGVWAYLQEWQAFLTVHGHGILCPRAKSPGLKWPEIKRYMEQYPDLTPADRADVICRVFKQKVNDFLSFLKEVKMFGDVSAVLYTIEFQKRGLPHCHTLLWVDSKNEMQDAQKIDNYISAKIPDSVQDPRGYKLVTELMMHGPCGAASSSAACMQKGSCSKHFPKTYNDWTFFDSNGHTHYRRRDTGVHVMKGESKLDNCDVVPYNRALYLAFKAHINVEYCGWSMLIKYIFKYISKGPDRILAKISNSDESTTATGNRPHIDEIQNYVDGRLICPYEACWRIFDFLIHSREPSCKACYMSIWKNMQRVTFCESDRLEIIDPPQHLLRDLHNKLLMEEKNYKRDLLREEAAEKTFLWRTITSSLRSHGKIVLAVASSGIASLLLPAGRTAHSRFKLPLELTDESLCHAKNKSQLGNLLVEIDLIIWDEAPMNDKRCFETLDRMLRDLMSTPNVVFRGKTIVLGGDFRQTLPVKKGASKEELIAASITESHLWPHFKVYTLKENMRLLRSGLTTEQKRHSKQFAKWLLDVGNGEIGEPDVENEQDSSWVTIPPEYTVTADEAGMSELIDFIYDDTTLKAPIA